MTDFIWTNGAGNHDTSDANNWVDVSTGLVAGSPPSFSDTAIIAAFPGLVTGAPVISSTGSLAVENFYVYGTTATSLEGAGAGNTYPGLDIGNAITWDVMTFASGNMYIGCGSTGTALMDEGVGFDDPNTFTSTNSMVAANLAVAGGTQTGAGLYQFGHARFGPGIAPADQFPVGLKAEFRPSSTGDFNLIINGDSPLFEYLAFSGASGGTTNLYLDRTVKGVFGALDMTFMETSITQLAYDVGGFGNTINLLWKATTATPANPLADWSSHWFTVPAINQLPSSINIIGTNNWRWRLSSNTIGPFYFKGDENSIALEGGAIEFKTNIIDDFRELVGYPYVNCVGSTLVSLDSITWESGYTSVDVATVWALQGSHIMSGGDVGGEAIVNFTCDASTSTAHTTSSIVLTPSTHSVPDIKAIVTSSDSKGPLSISYGGAVEIQAMNNAAKVQFVNGCSVTKSGSLSGAAFTTHGHFTSTPGPIESNGDWSTIAGIVSPTTGGNTAYISYHGQSGANSGTAGTYHFAGGSGTTYTYNINAPPGGSPYFKAAGIELVSGDISVAWPTVASEMALGDFTVHSGLGAGGVDFTNLATLYMDRTIAGSTYGITINSWAQWPTDGIPFVRANNGNVGYTAPDQAITDTSIIKPGVKYLYVEGASTTLSYSQGRIRQLSLTADTTISCSNPLRLMPTDGMTTYSDNATSTGMLAQVIELDFQDCHGGTAKMESWNTDAKGAINVAFNGCTNSTLQLTGIYASTVDIQNTVADVTFINTVEFVSGAGEVKLVTPPTVSAAPTGNAGTYEIKITSDLRCLSEYTTTASIYKTSFTGGTLICRNSLDNAYTDCNIAHGQISFNTPGTVSVQCMRWTTDRPSYLGTTTGHTHTLIEVYKSHSNPAVEADYAVWSTGNITGQSAIAGNSCDVAIKIMANESTEYAGIKQEGTIDGVTFFYTGFGIICDATKLTLWGTDHTLTGPMHYSGTETTYDGTLEHTQQNNNHGNCYQISGIMGVSSSSHRHIAKVSDKETTYTGLSNGITNSGSFILDMADNSATITFTHTQGGHWVMSTPDTGTSFGINVSATSTVALVTSAHRFQATNGDMKFTGTGEIQSTGDPALVMNGKKSDNSNTTLECTAKWTGDVYVEYGDGTTPTIVDYKWSNLGISPSDTYPYSMEIKAAATMRPAIETTGTRYLRGSGTFDWNSGFVGNQVFELTNNDSLIHLGELLENTITQTNGDWNQPNRTTWRCTSRADPSGDLLLPESFVGSVELGLRAGVSGAYTGAQTYRVPNAGMTISGRLAIDYADTGYAYGSAVLGGVGGLASLVTITGTNEYDRVWVYQKGTINNEISATLINCHWYNYGVANLTTFRLEGHNSTLTDSFNMYWKGATNVVATAYIDGKASGTTTITAQGMGTVTYPFTCNDLYIGTIGTGLTLSDTTEGMCYDVVNLTLGAASIIDSSTANSFWYFNATPCTIIDNNLTAETIDGESMYGTPNLGLIVVDSCTLTLDCTGGANRGLKADMLYLNDGVFKTTGNNKRTLYLRGNANVANEYAAAVTDSTSSGLASALFTRPTIHATGASRFAWPSTDTNWDSSSRDDVLILGQSVDANSGAAIFTEQAECQIGNVTGLAVTAHTFKILNYGAGIHIAKNNGLGVSSEHILRSCDWRGRDQYGSQLSFTNYNGSSTATRDTLEISASLFSHEVGNTTQEQVSLVAGALSYCDANITKNSWKGAYDGTIINLYSTVYEALTFATNQISSTGTGAIVAVKSPNQVGWTTTTSKSIIFERNSINLPNSVNGYGLHTQGIAYDDIGRNVIDTGSTAIPIDLIGAGDINIIGWSLPTANTKIGTSIQSSATQQVVSEFTNCTNLATTIIAGQLSHLKTCSAFAPDLWYAYTAPDGTTPTNPTLTIVHGEDTYRYGEENVQKIRAGAFTPYAAPINPIKIEWTNWDDSDPVTVEIQRYYQTGINASHNIDVTNGQVLDLNVAIDAYPAVCIGFGILLTFPTKTAAFKDFKITDNVTGSVLFADYQTLKLNTQQEAASTAGLLEMGAGASSAGEGYSGNRSTADGTNAQGALSHLYNSPKYQNIRMEISPDQISSTDTSVWAISFGAQDIDNQYVYRVWTYYSGGGTQYWDAALVKIVSGAETVLASSAGMPNVPNATGIKTMDVTWNTQTGEITTAVAGLSPNPTDFSVTDTAFTDGYFGVGLHEPTCKMGIKNVYVFEGDGTHDVIFRNSSLIFMPNAKISPVSSAAIVDFRDVTVNSNQIAVFPTLYDGLFTPYLENVSWADNRMDEVIETFVQLVGVELEVDGDIQLVDDGKLWLTGCYITGKNNKRWRIRTEQVKDLTTPSLKIEGCLLSGLLTTIRIPGASQQTFLLDDPANNVAVIRVQSDKDIEVVRQRVTGLDYDRMVFNGFESRQTTITCACVQNAYVMGMMEKLWRENTLIELISPYCYTYRGKITQFNQRILNPQISASQFVIEVEEWRED